jgi:hypothetical protein
MSLPFLISAQHGDGLLASHSSRFIPSESGPGTDWIEGSVGC